MKTFRTQPSRRAFTLIELMVSMTILMMLMLMLLSLTGVVQRTWSYTTNKVEQFRNAREGFETITRKLSQATLNTYWDYFDANGNAQTAANASNFVPSKYGRQSELRFISGNSKTLTTSAISPTHAIFFVAPLGYVVDPNYLGLANLLNTWGYFIEYADDSLLRPPFITTTMAPLRSRFRLMEMMGPSETMPLYKYTSGASTYKATTWFTDILKLSPRPARAVADNVLALIILPKLAPGEDPTGTLLSPSYTYDSTVTNGNADINPKNQLPPVVMVSMVAVDEASFSNYLSRTKTTAPMTDLGLDTLFVSAGSLTDNTKPGYAKDLKTLQNTLVAKKINFRVFTSDVSIKAAKWSRAQVN